MKSLIINLESSTERLAFQEKQFQKLGLSFEIMKAVSQEDLSQEEIETLSFGWERPLRSVELACFMSHKKAWEFVVKHNEPILILEDDALLSAHTKKILASLETKNSCDLATLEVRSRKKIVAKQGEQLSTDHKIFALYQDRTGAAAYVLWPSGAKKLLDKVTYSKPALADAFISSCYKLSAYQVEPAIAIQLDQCHAYDVTCMHSTNSTISQYAKTSFKELTLFSSILFRYRRIYSQFRMAFRQMSCLRVSYKREIAIHKDDFSSGDKA